MKGKILSTVAGVYNVILEDKNIINNLQYKAVCFANSSKNHMYQDKSFLSISS